MAERTSTASREKRASSYLYDALKFGTKEAFKRLRTGIICSFGEENICRVIGITSSQPGEGKSLISCNLAFCFAELGKRTLLIDGDLLRPSLYSKLGISIDPGLTDVMNDSLPLEGAIRSYTMPGGKTTIDVLTSGTRTENGSALLNSKRIGTLVDHLRESYDFIILDTLPIGSVSDTLVLTKRTDGVVVVVREGHCPTNLLTASVDQLRFSGVPILGFAMNGALVQSGKKYGYSRKYQSYYGHGYYSSGYYNYSSYDYYSPKKHE